MQQTNTSETAPAATGAQELLRGINTHLPAVSYLGFAFWFAWNLVAFSGSVWNTQADSAILISYLFIAHLLASVATLVALGTRGQRGMRAIVSRRFLAAGAAIGSAGTLLMILVGGGYIDSLATVIVGAALAGFGTTFMLARSATILCTTSPRRSFLSISLCALFAIGVYSFIEGYSFAIGAILFVLLPVSSALSLSVKRDSPQDLAVINTIGKLPARFRNLLIAIFVYSLCQEVSKSYILTALPASQSMLCMRYVMLALVVLMLVFIALDLSTPPDKSIARIFYPLALCFIVPQLAVSVLRETSPVLAAAALDFAGYGTDLFIWAICAYLGYQMRGNCVKVMCFGTAALSLGLASGSIVAIFLLDANISSAQFLVVNLTLAALCMLVTVIVFPENKLNDLIQPVEEEEDADDVSVRTQKALWKQACEEVAADGQLTAREVEVLLMLAKGMSAQQIADALVISIHTVRAHVRNIHAKLEVSNRAQIIELVEQKRDGICTGAPRA